MDNAGCQKSPQSLSNDGFPTAGAPAASDEAAAFNEVFTPEGAHAAVTAADGHIDGDSRDNAPDAGDTRAFDAGDGHARDDAHAHDAGDARAPDAARASDAADARASQVSNGDVHAVASDTSEIFEYEHDPSSDGQAFTGESSGSSPHEYTGTGTEVLDKRQSVLSPREGLPADEAEVAERPLDNDFALPAMHDELGTDNYADVMDKLRDDEVTTTRPQVTEAPLCDADVKAMSRSRGSVARHLPKLVGREFARQRNSIPQLAASLTIGILLTALLTAAASPDGLATNPGKIASMMVAYIVCLTFFSMAQSFSTVVDDRTVIEREARWSISATSTVLARAITCAPLAVTLGVLSTLLYVMLKSKSPADPVLPHPIGLFMFAVLLPLAAMAVGLFISTVSKSLRQAVFILMGVLALQVVMTGLAPQFDGGSGKVMKMVAYFTPSRWTSAGLGADHGLLKGIDMGPLTVDKLAQSQNVAANEHLTLQDRLALNDQLSAFGPTKQPSPFKDGIWQHDVLHVFGAAAALVVICVVALGCTILLLRRQLMATR